jgi:hypothetical protein
MQRHSTHFTGRMRRSYKHSCDRSCAAVRWPKISRKKFSRTYGAVQMAFSRSAGPCGPTCTGLGARRQPSGGGSRVGRMGRRGPTQVPAGRKPSRLWVMHLRDCHRTSESYCGCGKWRGNHTQNWRRVSIYLLGPCDQDCLRHAKRYEEFGTARCKIRRGAYEVRRSSGVHLCDL